MSKLQVDSVTKKYKMNPVLTDIYLSCDKGEIIGLLGRNGSGKSTLLKIIFGSEKADSKFVKVGDTQIQRMEDSYHLINYLPQDSFLPNGVKVRNVISLFCNKRDQELLLKHDIIKEILDKKCGVLSGGEKRFFEILLILYSDAEFLLLDEPFNGIAPIYAEKIKEFIVEHSATKGIIITDHHYMNVLDVATRVLLMYDGGIKEIKNMEELTFFEYLPK